MCKVNRIVDILAGIVMIPAAALLFWIMLSFLDTCAGNIGGAHDPGRYNLFVLIMGE